MACLILKEISLSNNKIIEIESDEKNENSFSFFIRYEH